MKVYLATWIGDPVQSEALTTIDANQRLLSYYFIMEQNVGRKEFIKYCKKQFKRRNSDIYENRKTSITRGTRNS